MTANLAGNAAPLPNRIGPQDHRLDLGAGGAAHAVGLGAQAGDLGAAGLDACHDGALYVEGREGNLK